MFQPSSLTDHLPVVIQLTLEGKDLNLYRSAMKHYDASMKAALSSYNLAANELFKLATGAELASDDEDA